MPPLTLADLQAAAGRGTTIRLHHGTDLASALDVQHNGLSSANAQALAGSGDFWATDDVNDADVFAKVNPANGAAARFDFDLPASVLIRLLSANPPHAQLHHGDGIEFFASGFSTVNSQMTNKQVTLVP